ncbi:hypothetical protein [Rhodobacter maris]|uniref:Mu-like prophage FluMu N-terminal domain-containing protein n=1 Tax=Rhodobacter maris TaxID=446682 RepID=A0A285TFV2_9RHOB|nr:hypothetical protein [Rhodobacter maris]SOC20618.1 hypothetical protein SAMN05877831_12012 [Rhodobacter maris]
MARKTNSTDSEKPQEAADLPSTEGLAGAAETVAPDPSAAPQDTPQPPSTEDSLDTARAEDNAEVQSAPGGITVTITGPKQGRWRAGRHFSAEPVVIELDDLSEDELAALRDDPALTVAVG